jgi:two-component system, NarL family, sensor histidine kinase DevS
MSAAIDRSLAQLEDDVVGLRALITELRPAALDQLGLEPALMALVDRARGTGLEIQAHVELGYEHGGADGRLTAEVESGVYRIVQESLTNAVKHGAAQRAIVEVVEEDGCVSVGVRDDGSGFDPGAPVSGFGLAGMRERVDLLEGRLDITSQPGEGTTVTVSVPAAHREAASDTDSAGSKSARRSA